MENKLYLYGASGHCKVIIDILALNGVAITAIVDDYPKAEELFGIPIIASHAFSNTDSLILSLGNNAVRKKLANLPVIFKNAIHPTAIISTFSKIDIGTVVMASAIINPGSSVGRHCIINTGAIVEHDCQIGDFAHISPGVCLAGNVTVGEGSHIGIGASVKQGIVIGKWATIGAGAVIIRNVPDHSVVVGNPGSVLREKNQEGSK
jgi:acetyltransferase EpsM